MFPSLRLCRLALLAALVASSALAATAAVPPRPNIVFIMADDHGPWAFGAAGDTRARTPNMDRLAREGARFTHAFSPTPVCSPARASILTSRYGSELGITDWINPAVDRGLGLAADLPTWPRLLQQAGYTTALFGKWHVGDLDEQHPTKRGYDSFFGFRGGGTPPRNPVLEKDGVSAPRPGFIVDLVADEAIAWLQQRPAGRPFAASIHFREPHAAHLPVPDEDWAWFKDMDPTIPNPEMPGLDVARVKKITREYLAAVAALDRNVGRILAALDRLQLAANTLVIYTSDHGYNLGHHGLLFKGNAQWMLTAAARPPGTTNVPTGQRPNLFDTSLQVPMLIRWPGVIRPGTVNAHTLSHLDWLPTFAALAGARIPPEAVIRGRDVGPLLRGEAAGWNDEFYSEYSMKHGALVHLRSLRTPEWKLIRDFLNEGRDELYDLAADPGETRNLIADTSPRVRRVIADFDGRILARMAALNDPALPLARARPPGGR